MPRVRAGEVSLGWREWGRGDVSVVFVHGNLASKDWIEIAAPLFPSGLRVIGIDWRGCGDSDQPEPAADYSNYSMQQHAEDISRDRRSGRQILPSCYALNGRHHCRAYVVDATGALWERILPRSSFTARYGLQRRSDRRFSGDDGKQASHADGNGQRGVLAILAR